MKTSPYKRILLKLSGESLTGSQPFGINNSACQILAQTVKNIKNDGFEVGIVIGGGNIFRGISLKDSGIAATPADQMGMLATLMNGIALQQALISLNCPVKTLSALDCPKVVESYTWQKALEYLTTGNVVIFVGGTGNPYFTTDTAAALRASEIQADILLKATKVDGIYEKDPKKYPNAKKYTQLSYSQYLTEKLEVMDATAVTLCRNNKIPVFVFNMQLLNQEKIATILTENHYGTLVQGE